jgi:LemA protein
MNGLFPGATTGQVAAWVAVAIAALVFLFVRRWLAAGNRIIALDERCNVAFADIDAHLKHRHNLIPPLVETVRGFAKHETELVLGVTRAQAEAAAAATPELKMSAEKKLSASLNTLFASAQKLPDIQASSHFNALRNELIDCENRITAARRFHNIVVGEFNASARQWPASMFAQRKGIEKRQVFDLGAERASIDQPVAIAF